MYKNQYKSIMDGREMVEPLYTKTKSISLLGKYSNVVYKVTDIDGSTYALKVRIMCD